MRGRREGWQIVEDVTGRLLYDVSLSCEVGEG
jgi:hypothetical protein